MKILIAEDDPTNTFILENILQSHGYEVSTAADGQFAWELVQQEPFDAVISDWMMPRMDGISLIREIRQKMQPVPALLIVTALGSPEAREHALDSGADDFVTKPYLPQEVLNALESCLARRQQSLAAPSPAAQSQQDLAQQDLAQKGLADILTETHPAPTQPVLRHEPVTAATHPTPPFTAVGITTNTGGPNALSQFFQSLPTLSNACLFVVLQAPAWALEMFAMRLQKQTYLKVSFAEDGLKPSPGNVYLAHKDRHLVVEAHPWRMRLLDSPPEHFCRPSADQLFHSLAQGFHRYAVAVALTGMGKDGLAGAASIQANGGTVIVQDPATADAPYLPQTLLEQGTAQHTVALPDLGRFVATHVNALPVCPPTESPVH
ncbi:MAG: chemotaxis protein CheB [Candidatus Melainabacteria bacterium]|nr:chemotaxis protein CheB [Candidatus Melainabacteria bacterium]